MFICIMSDIGYCCKILSDEIAKNSISLSMKDSNSAHAYKNSIVYEILNGIECLVTTHTSNIQILMKVFLMIIDRVTGGTAYLIRIACRLIFISAPYSTSCL